MIKRKAYGFTLIELIISLAVGLTLLAGVSSVFVGMKTTSSQTTGYGELQENGRFALSLLTNELSKQNFFGDFSGEADWNQIEQPLPNVAGQDCIGGGTNNATFPLPLVFGQFRTLWGSTVTTTNNMGCITDAVIGSDIMQLKRVISNPVADAALNNNRFYFRANAINGAFVAGNPGAVNLPLINGAINWEYQHHIYYVRNVVQGTGANAITVPVLMQGALINNGVSSMNFTPIIDGIEQIRFMYGVDTTGDGVVNTFLSADNMTNAHWDNENLSNILAVKVFVLTRAITPDQNYNNTNTYQLGDLAVTFNDNFRRLLYSATASIYNATTESWQ